MKLKGKNIILGVTGSIAAYKSAHLTRLLVKEGAQVKIIITPYGKEFITPVTLATLSKNTVLCDFFKYDDGTWNSHVDLGLWADLMLIAPATANTIAKMAGGICDNLLLTTYLSVKCPVMVAPAMDLDMFAHPVTQENISKLKQLAVEFVEPASGELASGLEGKGRMEEPQVILDKVIGFFSKKKTLNGKKIIVTAGPTYEPFDAVRFIGNYSSGKMGYAIADELFNRGAEVQIISGPVSISPRYASVGVSKVRTASEMYNETMSRIGECDVFVAAAAVADYSPENPSNDKLKKAEGNLSITLKPTPDILAHAGKFKKNRQILIGFALESNNEHENAVLKLKKKNLDLIVLNSLRDEGAGFMHDTNKVSFIERSGNRIDFEKKSKSEVARDIADKIEELIANV